MTSTTPPAALRPLQAPLRDLPAWTRHFQDAEIPIQAETAGALEDMRANEDDIDANMLGDVIAGDPLMSLKLMAHVSRHRSARIVTDPETVTAALVMMGIGPFFRNFGPQPVVEDWLGHSPEALAGLQGVLQRAYRAANLALGFAVHRMDHDAAVIYQAALLHDFAEMLLWCHAPGLALQIQAAQKADVTLRSNVIQRQVLNIELVELQQALMKVWRLPELLIRISDDSHAEQANVRNVILAIRLARHTAQGWSNAAIPDDITDIARLLNLSGPAALQLVLDIEPQ